MKKVIIYRLNNAGDQEEVVICTLGDDNKVIFSGQDKDLIEEIKNGIKNYNAKNEYVIPSQGELFLNELKYNFRTPYLSATDVMDC